MRLAGPMQPEPSQPGLCARVPRQARRVPKGEQARQLQAHRSAALALPARAQIPLALQRAAQANRRGALGEGLHQVDARFNVRARQLLERVSTRQRELVAHRATPDALGGERERNGRLSQPALVRLDPVGLFERVQLQLAQGLWPLHQGRQVPDKVDRLGREVSAHAHLLSVREGADRVQAERKLLQLQRDSARQRVQH